MKNEILDFINRNYKNISTKDISASDFVFEERVKQQCFHCKNHNYKWTCPPKIPQINYFKILSEYDNIIVLIYSEIITEENKNEIRTKSTNRLHKALLGLEKYLYKKNNSLALSFIGGSCKLCKNGCNDNKCANPHLARIPLEATGCNVIATMKNIDIDIVFPIDKTMYRFGIFAW